jgi:hypothetical protein
MAIGLILPAAAQNSHTVTPSELSRADEVLDGFGRDAVPLDGLWQFHLGDDPQFGSPSIDDRTGHDGWEQLSAGEPWGVQGHENYTGFGWY